MSSGDPYRLQRFVDAQQGVFGSALAELRTGRKTGHWMWFVFPQIAGFGQSAMSQRFAIRSLAEARAYLDHPILGRRLGDCVLTLQHLLSTSAEHIFGSVDAAKLRSSLTLFAAAAPEEKMFEAAVIRWFAGVRDSETLARVG